MKVLLFTISLLTANSTCAQACDCSSYPFKPNPPCYGKCVAKLSESKDTDLTRIRDLDPGVSLSIRVLAAKESRSEIDFSRINDKRQLEAATLKSIEDKELKLEANMPNRLINK